MLESAVAVPLAGTLQFIRYGFMPNRLSYCGPVGDNRTLFDYGIAGFSDAGLTPLLKRFTGALPYLQLIARANAIADPFDARVVEAALAIPESRWTELLDLRGARHGQ